MRLQRAFYLALAFCAILFLTVLLGARARWLAEAAATSAAAPAKQLWHCGMHPQVILPHPGNCPICGMALTPLNAGGSAGGTERKILYWWDPMLGPGSISDHPGKSAMGMDLVPVYADEAGPEVTIDPMVVQNMGVRTAPVTRGPLHKAIRTFGLLRIPEPAMHDVTLKVSGWIDRLFADQEGIHVEAGEPLFALYSPELQVAAQELIAAVKTEKSLATDSNSTARVEAQRMVDSAKRKLRLWDIAEEDIDTLAKADQPPKDILYRSPAFGHVEDKAVVTGSAVQPGLKLMRIADHRKMWLDVQVYDQQFEFVKIGQEVTATIDAMPNHSFKGAITFIYPHIDHMTRTFTVRLVLDNPDFALRPGMYATAEIKSQPVADAILAPREAVIDTGDRQIAFVADVNGHFLPRKVRMGLFGDDDRVQILEGLAPGEMVVTSGQFLMDVESRTIEAAQKLAEPAAMVAQAAPLNAPAATHPAVTTDELSIVYCPMRKADWVQKGDTLANPYFGKEMPDCGAVKKKVPMPQEQLAEVMKTYLKVQAALSADTVDGGAVQSLKSAAGKLTGNQYTKLRKAADDLSTAKDIKKARDSFVAVSEAIVSLLETSRK